MVAPGPAGVPPARRRSKPADADEYGALSSPTSGRPADGVGSNGSQPYPRNQTSTHAWASWSVTVHVPVFASYVPLEKPTATRAGTPR